MKGAADFAVNMVRVVGRKDRLCKEGRKFKRLSPHYFDMKR
jgi:hypothetical protein